MEQTRRGFLKWCTSSALSAVAISPPARIITQINPVKPLPRPQLHTDSTKLISLVNLKTGEKLLDCPFQVNGNTCPDAAKALKQLLRDHRTNVSHAMDSKLFELLHSIQTSLETTEPLQVISGYRCAKTNRMLKGAKRSYHMRGQAIDIIQPDRSIKQLTKAALLQRAGGVGGYADFVHVDTGPLRKWGRVSV